MMSLRPSFRAAALALSAVAVAFAAYATRRPAPAAKPAAPPRWRPRGCHQGDATKGAAKYKVMCVACHRPTVRAASRARAPEPNWTLKKTWDATRTEGFFRNCIVNGNAKSGMVAWGKTGALKPQEVEDVIAFILTHKAKAK
jgi:mono/diheme cytochrome c family protein